MTQTLFQKKDYPLSHIQNILQNQTIAILGYGIQGRAQSLNLRDQGFNVIVGQREASIRFQDAQNDDWQVGKTLFSLEEAAQKADIVFYLLSDSGQKEFWPTLSSLLTPQKTLVFAHGFSIVYSEHTDVHPQNHYDVILVAPKGSGKSLRENFLNKQAITSSFAVHQDVSKTAKEKSLALCFAIGSTSVFETTFQKEVYSDLVSERGLLLGGLMALIETQYEELRKNNHSPEEAFNDSVEELTQWLAEMIGTIGFDGVLKNCSETAKWGAFKWRDAFKKSLAPIFDQLYKKVSDGSEAQYILSGSQDKNFLKQMYQQEKDLSESELWQIAKAIRRLRE